LADLVINDEEEAIVYKPSVFVCEPSPVIKSITCDLDGASTGFCGWNTSSTSGTSVEVGVLYQATSDIERNAYLFVVPKPDATPGASKNAMIESSTLSVTNLKAEFSFWYLLRGSVVQLVASDAGRKTNITTLQGDIDDYHIWVPASFKLDSLGSTSLKVNDSDKQHHGEFLVS
jgi:hypothetical protein